jgi:hypothetical protein
MTIDQNLIASTGDHLEVTDALYRFGAGIDHNDLALIASAFSEDLVVDFGPCGRKMDLNFPLLTGHETVVGFLNANARSQTTSHVITNGRVLEPVCFKPPSPRWTSRSDGVVEAKHTKSAKKQSVWRVARLTESRAEAAELAQERRRALGRLQRRRYSHRPYTSRRREKHETVSEKITTLTITNGAQSKIQTKEEIP